MDHRATVVLLVLLMALAYVAGDPCVCDGSFGTSPWENKVSQTRAENGKPFIDAKVFPLHNATAKWDMRGMKAAIAKGANVNQRATEDGLTPLQIALLTNSLDTWHPYTEEVYQAVKILLDAKADPNIPYSPEAHRMHDVSPAPLHYA
ncbi:hypothetical protein MNEG_11721 [Monoraphidium neglectum]|uniref:Uncharacterized protein n=1 Tax=Monoraphidium neglectum TaxID=145388 RepID=A0A0D2M4N5_9CHLO|nr:hypothetical protein MNEG_11721 [Monoraphidium neglectum]KIY96241.1 hypothetical protein MNEG_11721 [Monoraphidium neglectum]|eukprot:XP_013895261.1 hypothetical protein MNEG_11721 [Monoraphidium neglectum]